METEAPVPSTPSPTPPAAEPSASPNLNEALDTAWGEATAETTPEPERKEPVKETPKEEPAEEPPLADEPEDVVPETDDAGPKASAGGGPEALTAPEVSLQCCRWSCAMCGRRCFEAIRKELYETRGVQPVANPVVPFEPRAIFAPAGVDAQQFPRYSH